MLISHDALVGEDLAYLQKSEPFRSLLRDGARIRSLRSIYPTVTYPAHASLITGVYPERHGVVGNEVCSIGTLGAPLRGEVAERDRALAADALERLGIAALADRDVMTLSTGQVRRVLVVRELVRDPQVLIFDEPCTGLDPEGMYHVRSTMSLLAAKGRSVVLVTHYPEDIIPEIDRVLLIKDAEVFADGAKADLLTSEVMSELFDVPLVVGEACGWYSLRGAYA